MPHVVDELIEERAERLRRLPLLWHSLRPLLYPLLGYRKAIAMADTIAPMTGPAIFEHLSEELDLDVHVSGLEHVPASGLAVVTVNHPSGIADGIAVFDALRRVRSDISFLANRDAIRVAPGLAEMVVPVEWMEKKRSHARRRETVHALARALREQRLLVIFPAGRLARPTLRGLVERPWQTGALALALKYGAPVVPLRLEGRNSWLYYLFYAIHHELRDMTLFRELLNKRGRPYRLRVGAPFQPEGDARALAEQLRGFVAGDMARGEIRFSAPGTASPVSPPRHRSS